MLTAKFQGSKFWVFALIFFLILGLTFYSTWLIEPYSPPQNLSFSNITDHQITISWVTKIPTRGTIITSGNGSFPILPIFAKTLQKDDGEKNTLKIGYYTTHHITIGNLLPSKKYNFRIFQGQKKVYQGEFVTGSTLSTLSNPNPVYGKVLKSDKKTAVVGAIVYLRVEKSPVDSSSKESTSSSMLSTLTNKNGGWSLDLANLRDLTLRKNYPLSKKAIEEIIIETGSLGRVKTATVSGQDKPWSDIILKQ